MLRWKQRKKEIEMNKEGVAQRQIGYEISAAASQVSSASESLFLTIEDNRISLEELFAKSQEMTAQSVEANQELITSLEDLDRVIEVIHKVEGATNQLKVMNGKATDTIQDNLQTILSVVHVIEGIQETSKATKEYVHCLDQATGEILHILDTVSQISRKTHLLALNASIEAARAGEYGRGFSIVAEEIRQLSTHTSDAVQEVSHLIDTVQSSLKNVNTCVDLNAHKVEEGVNLSRYIETSLGQMQYSFDQVTGCIQEIDHYAEQEVALAVGVDKKMHQVKKLSMLTDAHVETMCYSMGVQKDRMGELEELDVCLQTSAKDLNSLVEGHKLNDLSHINLEEVGKYRRLLEDIVKEGIENQRLIELKKESHEQFLGQIKKQYPMIEAIWSNTTKGRFLYSIPAAGISNASIREWFKEAMNGKSYTSAPYISAITKHPCVTLSYPIQDLGGAIVGVVGMDVKVC